MKGRENSAQNQPFNEASREFTNSNDHSDDWSTERIKLEIELCGHSLASLSRQHGLHESACRIALRKPWPRVERIIADFLGLDTPAPLFPDRYDANGYPLKFAKHLGNQNAKRKKGPT